MGRVSLATSLVQNNQPTILKNMLNSGMTTDEAYDVWRPGLELLELEVHVVVESPSCDPVQGTAVNPWLH
jgi:hypothetical protein